MVAENPLAALPDLVSRPVRLLVEATTSPLVNLFLTLGEGIVRLVVEPLHVHTDHLFGRKPPHYPALGNCNLMASATAAAQRRDSTKGMRGIGGPFQLGRGLGTARTL